LALDRAKRSERLKARMIRLNIAKLAELERRAGLRGPGRRRHRRNKKRKRE
jgi:hypothetical protein